MQPEIIDWITSNFLPFEAELRKMLRRVCSSDAEIDDVVQETYCKVLMQDSLVHVREPRAFLVRTAKNLVTDRLRREAIVSIEAMANLEALGFEDAGPTPEQVVLARSELNWVIGLISNLPNRCKQVFRARRIYGLSQAETAQTLGMTEGMVEWETMRGMDMISDMVAQVGVHNDPQHNRISKRARKKTNVNDR